MLVLLMFSIDFHFISNSKTISFLYIHVYRKLLTEYTSVTMDQMNLVTFGMSAVSLVGAVVQLAMIDSADAESIYRNYLGKVACCHFSLVRFMHSMCCIHLQIFLRLSQLSYQYLMPADEW